MSEAETILSEQQLLEKAVQFPQGIPGFPHSRLFVFNQLPEEMPFAWMRNLEDANIAFAVVSVHDLMPDYSFAVDDEEIKVIGEPTPAECAIYVIVRIEPMENGIRVHANLRAPILVNPAKRLGMQVVLQNTNYEDSALFEFGAGE